ncbi:MAG: VWA domain-containing protein [Bryobacteraceae bacterium]
MRRALPLFAAALLATPLYPQDAPPTIKVDVNLVNVLFSVRNKSGGLVGNLEKSDFTIAENGQQQEIKYFTREADLPLTLGLLVDVSLSQQRLIETEKRAASAFFSQVLRKKDEAFLISFGEDAELLQDYTNSARLLNSGLDQLKLSAPVGGLHPGPVPTMSHMRGTILYDAVYLATAEQLRGQVGRKAVVLITDGIDEGSRYTKEKAIEAAQKADAIIYSIEYMDRGAYGMFMPSDSALRQMSEDTGGRVFRVDRKHSLDDVFREIQDELRSQYAIGYAPTNSARDSTFRKIDIRTTSKDLKVQARKGYYATPAPAE